MYEDLTYEELLRRMLARVSSTLDKREGSPVWVAEAPAAAELRQVYIELDRILKESFADTQSRTSLIRRAAERGLVPYPATQAIRKGVFSREVPIGSRFSLDSLNYVVLEKISEGEFRLVCETYGEAGNADFGPLLPIVEVPGLESAELTDVLIPGEDEESTEAFRKRYFRSFSALAFGGNRADYLEKTRSLPGVGGVKLYRAWKGGGTVRLMIQDAAFAAPSRELVDDVQRLIDPEGHGGDGLGFAPIGHTVTVEGALTEAVDISASVTYQTGRGFADTGPGIEAAVDSYLLELARSWEDSQGLVVRISQLESRILEVDGVLDISDTTLGGRKENLQLGEEKIPVRGALIA